MLQTEDLSMSIFDYTLSLKGQLLEKYPHSGDIKTVYKVSYKRDLCNLWGLDYRPLYIGSTTNLADRIYRHIKLLIPGIEYGANGIGPELIQLAEALNAGNHILTFEEMDSLYNQVEFKLFKFHNDSRKILDIESEYIQSHKSQYGVLPIFNKQDEDEGTTDTNLSTYSEYFESSSIKESELVLSD